MNKATKTVHQGMFCTLEGFQAPPSQFSTSNVVVEHIAIALSNICRFGGFVTRFYSEAQHAVILSYLVEEEHGTEAAKAALISNAHVGYANLGHDEEDARAVICAALDVDSSLVSGPALHKMDETLLATEYRDLKPEYSLVDLGLFCGPDDEVLINPMRPSSARKAYLDRFEELFGPLDA